LNGETSIRIVDYHLKERIDGQNSKISLSGRIRRLRVVLRTAFLLLMESAGDAVSGSGQKLCQEPLPYPRPFFEGTSLRSVNRGKESRRRLKSPTHLGLFVSQLLSAHEP